MAFTVLPPSENCRNYSSDIYESECVVVSSVTQFGNGVKLTVKPGRCTWLDNVGISLIPMICTTNDSVVHSKYSID